MSDDMYLDPTGVKLTPSHHGKDCAGYVICCDECAFFQECFPDWRTFTPEEEEAELIDRFARRHGAQCFGSSPAQIMTPEESAELAEEWRVKLGLLEK